MKSSKFLITILSLGFVGWVLLMMGVQIPLSEEELTSKSDTISAPYSYQLEIPEEVDFCGEVAPLTEDPDIMERFDRELYVNAYWHSHTIFLLKRAHKFFPVIERILKEEGVPDDFKYLAMIESDLTNALSPSGAAGFWQFMKPTAGDYKLKVNSEVDERYHLEKSTRAACKYFKKAYQKFGSWTTTAAAYNRGSTGMANALNDQKVNNYYDLLLNEETSRYVFRILAVKAIHQNPEKYHFALDQSQMYTPERTKIVKIKKSIENLALFAFENDISYKTLKRHNPWLRSNKLTIRKGEKYEVRLPM